MQPWRERILTALLVVVIAVPVGIVIGGGLDFGGPDEEVLGVVETTTDVAGAETTTTTPTSTSAASGSSTTTAAPATTTTTAAPGRAPADVRLRFYNGSRTAGAAVTVGDRLEAAGYRVLPPGPSPADPIESTVVAYKEGFQAEAAAVARALGVDPAQAVKPMPPTPAVTGIGEADVVVIVAEDALD